MTLDTLISAEDAATMTLYKVTGRNGEPLHGGSGRWPLPTDGQPGEWWDVDGEVQGCRTGLHLTDREHLMSWVPAAYVQDSIIHRVEWRGPLYRVGAGDKYVVGSARLLPRTNPNRVDPRTLYARRDAAVARATRRAQRAERKLRRSIGDGWAVMAGKLGRNLPDIVPARVRDAILAYKAECDAAASAAHAATLKCNAAIGRAMLPD